VIDPLGPVRAASPSQPVEAPSPSASDAKVQQEFEVLLVRQLLKDLKLPGLDGQAAMFSDILEENLARQIVEARGLSGPVGSPSSRSLEPSSTEGVGRRSSRFGWRSDPFHGARKFHSGVDLSAPIGTPIAAVRAGTVLHAGPAGGYGNLVVVDHGGGITTRYAHCSTIDVRAGDPVAAGQRVGRVGSTGRSTGPHLHFEVRNGGTAIDPETWLDGAQGSVHPIRGETGTGSLAGGS
jgi:murein DD-endopeptidase MepM/ murein hydrolase activator NlpD